MVALPHTFTVEPEFKRQFAVFIHRGFSPFVAAHQLWPNDAGFAMRMSELWAEDEYVLAYRDKLRTEEENKNKPPTKEAQIKRIEGRLGGMDDEDYIKAERLIAEMSGHIEKAAAAQVNLQQNIGDRVIVVKDHGDDEQWESKLRAQQTKLIEAARA